MQLSQRAFGLDILRATAISLVVVSHTSSIIIPSGHRNELLTFMGHTGVELFFVLSGFLIGTIILKSQLPNQIFIPGRIVHFWTRRWFRTLPNYYLVLLIYFAVDIDRLIYTAAKYDIWKYFLFLQSALPTHTSIFAVSWSLAIEEWFYFLFPLAYLLFQLIGQTFNLKNYTYRAYVITAIFFIVSGLVMSLALTYMGWGGSMRKFTPVRIGAIAVGAIAAYIKFFNKPAWGKYKLPFLILGAFIFIVINSHLFTQTNVFDFLGKYYITLYLTVLLVAIAFMLPYFDLFSSGQSSVTGKAITHISLVSYSIYLIHPLIIRMHNNYLSAYLHPAVNFILTNASIIVLSTLLYTFYEKPMTNLRERFS